MLGSDLELDGRRVGTGGSTAGRVTDPTKGANHKRRYYCLETCSNSLVLRWGDATKKIAAADHGPSCFFPPPFVEVPR
jgi:hypothetical protein